MAKGKGSSRKREKVSGAAPAPKAGIAGPSNFSTGMARDATRTNRGTLPTPVRPPATRGRRAEVSRGSASITVLVRKGKGKGRK